MNLLNASGAVGTQARLREPREHRGQFLGLRTGPPHGHHPVGQPDRERLLGAPPAGLGVTELSIVARSQEKSAPLVALGDRASASFSNSASKSSVIVYQGMSHCICDFSRAMSAWRP